MERQGVKELKQVEEKDINEILRNQELEILENELKLVNMGTFLPSLNHLTDKSLYFLFNFIDNEMYNEYSGKYTKGDILQSYIMTHPDYKVISLYIWESKEINIGTEEKPNYVVKYTINNFPYYRKIKQQAIKYWNDNKLNNYLEDVKKLFDGNINRNDVIRDAIYNDAINNEISEKERTENRKLYLEISGMKKEKVNNNVLVFSRGGGKDLVKSYEMSSDKEIRKNVDSYIDMEDD